MIPSAQEIFDYSVLHNLKLCKGGIGHRVCCVRAVLTHMIYGTLVGEVPSIYSDEVKEHYGLSGEEMDTIEAGFEGWNNANQESPYYKLGKEVMALAELNYYG